MKEDSAVPGLVAPTLRVHVWRIKTWQSPQDVVLNQSTKCWNAAWPHTGSLFSPAEGRDRDRARTSAPSLQLRGRAIARSLAAHIPSTWPACVGEREGTLLHITAAGQSLHARFGGHRQVHQQRVAAEKHPGD